MKLISFFLPVLLLLATACSPRLSGNFQSRFVPSKRPPFEVSPDQKHVFGFLEVPENRSKPGSKTLRLPVYIFKSRSANPQPDPIIYTVGGPGASTMPSAQYSKYYSYLDDRDFIFFEQRGTAFAQPSLDCPDWAEAVQKAGLPGVSDEAATQLLANAAKSCRKRLVQKGRDLDGYRSREIAADIADLVETLEIKQYNLLTISYSTKIAQVLLRDHPQGIKSVVMDSPLPLEVNYDEESVANLMEVVDQLLSDCETDPGCEAAFPKLKDRFFNYLERISKHPLEVQLKHPETGAMETFYLRGKDLITVFTSASTQAVPEIPKEINKLLEGDFSKVREQLSQLFAPPGSGAGIGMRLSVWCAEEFPFVSQAIVQQETSRYPEVEGLSPAVFDSNVCRIWSVAPEPKTENQPVSSEVPVLLISGSYDSETPAKWAKAMQMHLPNSFHLVFDRWKHTPTTNWSNPCGMEMARAFFNNPSQKPALKCYQELVPFSFDLE